MHLLAKVTTYDEPACLVYLVGTALFLAPLVAARLSPRPLFGGLFVLTQAPLFACALVSTVRLQAAIVYAEGPWRYDPDNMALRLHEVFAPALLGFSTTLVAVALHLMLWTICRRRTA